MSLQRDKEVVDKLFIVVIALAFLAMFAVVAMKVALDVKRAEAAKSAPTPRPEEE